MVQYKKGLKLLGVFFTSLGIAIFLHPLSRFTGYVISEEIQESPLIALGLILFSAGILCLIFSIERKKKSIKRIVEESLEEVPLNVFSR